MQEYRPGDERLILSSSAALPQLVSNVASTCIRQVLQLGEREKRCPEWTHLRRQRTPTHRRRQSDERGAKEPCGASDARIIRDPCSQSPRGKPSPEL